METKKEVIANEVSTAIDTKQSPQCNNNILPNSEEFINDFERMQREMLKQLQPSYLKTISMPELYNQVFEVQTPLIEGLLYRGTYLFVGSPKVGKSFMMAQLAYHVSTGLPLWNYKVRKSTVLYFALEDDYARLQQRMFKMFGAEETEDLYFATECKTVNDGLDEQIRGFLTEHPDTGLIIIDTLKKVREVGGAEYSYASDYDIVSRLKALADNYKVTMLIVHHTRKQKADDVFDTISGTNGLLGAADGAFVLSKDKRTVGTATLEVTGRDQEDMKITLTKDKQTLVWNFEKSETEIDIEPPDPLLEKLNEIIFSESNQWDGTASELAIVLGEKIPPNVLSLRLSTNANRLYKDYGIRYQNSRTHSGRKVTLSKEV
ncbi:AAA family ATPase [Faecalibacillus intestinalis]